MTRTCVIEASSYFFVRNFCWKLKCYNLGIVEHFGLEISTFVNIAGKLFHVNVSVCGKNEGADNRNATRDLLEKWLRPCNDDAHLISSILLSLILSADCAKCSIFRELLCTLNR